jgi:hypothetical protein
VSTPRIITAVHAGGGAGGLNPDFILEDGLTFDQAASQLLRVMMYGMVREIWPDSPVQPGAARPPEDRAVKSIPLE